MKQIVSSEIDELVKAAKVTFLRAGQEKANFPGSRAVLLISVGQSVHEGAKLAATIDMVNKNFSSCDVAVCDSLQRHTMEIYQNLSKETLYLNANIEGEKWLERNDSILKSIKIPHEIFRWDKYLLDDDFKKYQQLIELAYREDGTFAHAIEKTINEFIERYGRRFKLINKEDSEKCCLRYLVEEAAIIMLMWPQRRYNYIVYPGEVNKALEAARRKFVAPVAENLLRWLGVYVRTRNAYTAHKERSLVSNVELV